MQNCIMHHTSASRILHQESSITCTVRNPPWSVRNPPCNFLPNLHVHSCMCTWPRLYGIIQYSPEYTHIRENEHNLLDYVNHRLVWVKQKVHSLTLKPYISQWFEAFIIVLQKACCWPTDAIPITQAFNKVHLATVWNATTIVFGYILLLRLSLASNASSYP